MISRTLGSFGNTKSPGLLPFCLVTSSLGLSNGLYCTEIFWMLLSLFSLIANLANVPEE